MKFLALFVSVAVATAAKSGLTKCPKISGKYPFDEEKVYLKI